MKAKRFYSFALACLMFAISQQLFENYILWFGFRDRSVSELDFAEHTLANCFVWFSIAMGVWFLSLGLLSFRVEIKKQLMCACILFLFAAAISIALDLYFRSYMMDSSGG